MDTEPGIEVEVADGVATLTLHNPTSRNAMTWTMLEQLAAAFDRVDDDDSIEVVVLTGAAGDFCAGGDLKTLATRSLDQATSGSTDLQTTFAVAFRALQRDRRVTVPTIAAIEGFAVGGGMEIVLATDIRIAAEDARLSLPEVKRGLFPAAGGVVRALQQLPYPVAAQLLLTGEEVSARRAFEIGLVSEVVAPGTALERAKEIAAAIRANSPASVRGITQVLRTMATDRERAPMDHELTAGMQALATGEAYTGVAAFTDKTEASYR